MSVHTFLILQPLSPLKTDEGKQTILNDFQTAGITDACEDLIKFSCA